jgi:hypothetical protein
MSNALVSRVPLWKNLGYRNMTLFHLPKQYVARFNVFGIACIERYIHHALCAPHP